jgi:hypothetical protein
VPQELSKKLSLLLKLINQVLENKDYQELTEERLLPRKVQRKLKQQNQEKIERVKNEKKIILVKYMIIQYEYWFGL